MIKYKQLILNLPLILVTLNVIKLSVESIHFSKYLYLDNGKAFKWFHIDQLVKVKVTTPICLGHK